MTENREIWMHEMRPAQWLAERLTLLVREFDLRYSDEPCVRTNGGVSYYIDGEILLVHDGVTSGSLKPNDVDEWSYHPA